MKSTSISIRRVCQAAVWLGLLAGCSGGDKEGPASFRTKDYFPMHKGERWTYVWNNQRGDQWTGTMRVEKSHKRKDGVISQVVDSVNVVFSPSFTRSVYRRSDRGLENLYRLTAEGDCTVYEPARLILPQTIKLKETVADRYQSTTYNPAGAVKQRASVNQVYKLLGTEAVSSAYGNWDMTILIENIRTTQTGDAPPVVSRSRIHYARNNGPVKIEERGSEESPASTLLTGLMKSHTP